MKYAADGRRLPAWIRLYTSTFSLIKAATPYQAGEAIKSAVDHIQTGKEPDISDALVSGIYEILLDGAEHSMEEYAAKVEGGKKGAAIVWDTHRIPKTEPEDSYSYLRRTEGEQKQETDIEGVDALKRAVTPSDILEIAKAKKINVSSSDAFSFCAWAERKNWQLNGKPFESIGAVLRTYIEEPEKLGVI